MGTSFQLSVPDPCGENWDQMAPRGHGSFCTSCEKVVVDFTKMSDREVMQYVKANANRKVCGRFTKDQLDRPLSPSVNLDASALKAFVYVLFLVFGASLFSYTMLNDEQHIKNRSTSENFSGGMERVEELGVIHYTVGEPIIPPMPGDGGVSTITQECECDVPPPPPPLPPPPIVEPYVTMGEPMMYVEQPLHDMEKDTVYLEELHVRAEDKLYVLGGPVCYFVSQGCSTQGVYEQQVEKIEQPTLDAVPVPTLSTFPNPSSGTVNIKYVIPARTDVSIELFDLNGNRVIELISAPQLYEGTYIFPLDLSGFDNGTYICTMKAGELQLSEKIVIVR